MLTSIAVILLLGLFMGWVFSKLKLPSLMGMIIVGINYCSIWGNMRRPVSCEAVEKLILKKSVFSRHDSISAS